VSYLYRVFLKGLLTLLPISVTLYLLAWIASSAEEAFGFVLKEIMPHPLYFPGAGVIFVIILVFLVGLLVDNYLTQHFFKWLEAQLEKTPVIRSIYSPLKDVTQLFARSDKDAANQRVVLVYLEGLGAEVMGLVTRDQFTDLPPGSISSGSVTVFVPFSYGVGGFTLIVPKSRIRETSIPAEKAMQLAITGWIKSVK
jgi:uncharacterized membrane protein